MFVGSGVATQFHQAFYTQLVQEIFAVMTGGWFREAWGSWRVGGAGGVGVHGGWAAARGPARGLRWHVPWGHARS